MAGFGRKQVAEDYSDFEFGRLVHAFDRLRTIRTEDVEAEDERIGYIADARDADAENIPDIYGHKMVAAKGALDDKIAPLNNYLEAVSMSWRIVPQMLIGPSVWKGTPLGNFLIYSLGLSPFDPWNQLLTVNHPIGSVDLEMAPFQPEAEEQLSADFCRRYQLVINDWDVAEKAYAKRRDIAILADVAEASRTFIDGDTRHIRKIMAWNCYRRIGAEPRFY